MNCKKCGIGYGEGRCHGMISYGEVLLCDDCNKLWEPFYQRYKEIRFPDGIPFYWINWSETKDRDELFKEWCKPKKVGCFWCQYRKEFKCSAYTKDRKKYNQPVCGSEYAKKEKDLLMIVNIKKQGDYYMYGKPYGFLCREFKSNGFQFR